MLSSQDKTVVDIKAIMSHENKNFINVYSGNSLEAQWLGLSALTAMGLGSIPLVRELRSRRPQGVTKKNVFSKPQANKWVF